MWTKQQAAQFLGVPALLVDWYVAAGRLTKHPGDLFDETELQVLKTELTQAQAYQLAPQVAQQPPPTVSQLFPDLVREFLNRLFERLSEPDVERALVKLIENWGRERSDESFKGAFTVKGASNRIKVPESTIRKDIKSGKLPAKQVGGILKIKQADLFAYNKKEWK